MREGMSNYIPLILQDAITCPCPWYTLLTQHSASGDIRFLTKYLPTSTHWTPRIVMMLTRDTTVCHINTTSDIKVGMILTIALQCLHLWLSSWLVQVITCRFFSALNINQNQSLSNGHLGRISSQFSLKDSHFHSRKYVDLSYIF